MFHDVLSEVFSAGGFIAAVAGAGIDRGIWFLHDRYLDATQPDGKPHRTSFTGTTILSWVIGVILLGWMVIQTEDTHAATVAEARRALSCEQHIVAAAVARDKLNDQLDDLATEDRQATQDWLTQITAPPLNIADLHTTDPQYQAWAIGITNDYRTRNAAVKAQRDELGVQLKQHPLPQAACGNPVN